MSLITASLLSYPCKDFFVELTAAETPKGVGKDCSFQNKRMKIRTKAFSCYMVRTGGLVEF